MTKAEKDADIETLEEAKRAALRAIDRVSQNSGLKYLRAARAQIEGSFEAAIAIAHHTPTTEE